MATKIESNQLAMSFSSGVVIGDDENFESDKALFSQQLNLINPGQDFLDDKAEAEAEKVAAGSMLPGQTGFLGFQFMADPSADILNAYAMVRPNTDGSITLIKTGYDDQGGAIKTVPVPGPLALMALGAAGIAGLRRRQKK